jgi:hypothetical protein
VTVPGGWKREERIFGSSCLNHVDSENPGVSANVFVCAAAFMSAPFGWWLAADHSIRRPSACSDKAGCECAHRHFAFA